MKKIRDFLRPLFRLIVEPHVKALCKETMPIYNSYKNKYEGRRCFIVANGPSLRMEDLEKLKKNNEITFGFNRIYALYDRTDWRPSFYITQDPTIIRTGIDETREQVNNSVVFIKSPGEHKYDVKNAIYYNLDYRRSQKGLLPDFYNGSNCIFADGKTVVYTALQLAVYMGFKEIYLLGTDCNYSKDNSITQESYPDPRMFDPKKVGMPADINYWFSAYEIARKYAENHGVKIYNATRGGMLEVFDRVIFDSLF